MTVKLLDMEENRRDGILNAALKEFAKKGYDDASTNVIAKEAGISKPLMFHYVNSKQELFLLVYDYFSNILEREYVQQIDYNEKDIFEKLRQSYVLQIKLMKKYPWVFELNKLLAVTKSKEVNSEMARKRNERHLSCYPKLFDMIDKSKFRPDLDIETCKQFIFWSNIGFVNQMLEDIRDAEYSDLDYEVIIAKLNHYFVELRKIFYTSENETNITEEWNEQRK